MPENQDVEIAHALSERGTHAEEGWKTRREELIEIAEAFVLALVAVAAAWSGYQAAKWDGREAHLYGTSSYLVEQAGVAANEGGQLRLLDVSTFNTWIQAHRAGDQELEDLYVKRFSPEYRVAFDAWLKTDPFNNPDAPAGPISMPEYHNARLERSKELNDHGIHEFEEGTQARATSEKYVAATVLLATVLFLIAISQRFKLRNVRIGVLVVAAGLMVFVIASIATYPHA